MGKMSISQGDVAKQGMSSQVAQLLPLQKINVSPRVYNHIPPLGGGCKGCEPGAVFSAFSPSRTHCSVQETAHEPLGPIC